MSNYLLPPNATPQEVALEQATARISDVPLPIRDTANPNACPDVLLPWLAWAYSVDEWDPNWTTQQKRDSIKTAAFVQRYKGTIGALREALAALGYELQVQEWFQQDPIGAEYTFRVLLNSQQVGASMADLVRILSVVDSYKNLRSHLDSLVPSVTTTAGPTVAVITNTGHELTLTNYRRSPLVINPIAIVLA